MVVQALQALRGVGNQPQRRSDYQQADTNFQQAGLEQADAEHVAQNKLCHRRDDRSDNTGAGNGPDAAEVTVRGVTENRQDAEAKRR